MANLSTPQQELAEFMSELSEEAYAAGWMADLEYELWTRLEAGGGQYGRLDCSADMLNKLRALSEACGGWIVWDESAGETWISTEEWDTRYADWSASRPEKGAS